MYRSTLLGRPVRTFATTAVRAAKNTKAKAGKKPSTEKKLDIDEEKTKMKRIPLTNETSLRLQHVQYLMQFYNPKTVQSIMMAESAINPEDYANKKFNTLGFAPSYLTDFTRLDPYFDHLQQNPESYMQITQPNAEDVPTGVIESEEDAESAQPSELQEMSKKLSLATGFDEDYVSQLSVKTLVLKTVRNQTAKGKLNSFYALVCAGDRNGMLGIGEGKDPDEPNTAILKAHWQAVKNLVKVPRLEDRTIYGNVEHKFGATIVQMRSAPPGSGLRCNPMIFELAQCAGLKDLSAKVYRSRKKMNVVKCSMEAFLKQKTTEEIALERGKKVVDLRKIYYTSDSAEAQDARQSQW